MEETLGDRLRKLRKQSNLTQAELAEKVGMLKNTYVRYETNQRKPTSENIARLADFFGVSVPELVYGELSTPRTPPVKTGSDDLLRFLLFGDKAGVVTDEQYAEVKNFAAYIASKAK